MDLLNFNSINPLTHNKQENKDCNEINSKEIIDGLKNEILHLKKRK
jgi:hypothetical protein